MNNHRMAVHSSPFTRKLRMCNALWQVFWLILSSAAFPSRLPSRDSGGGASEFRKIYISEKDLQQRGLLRIHTGFPIKSYCSPNAG